MVLSFDGAGWKPALLSNGGVMRERAVLSVGCFHGLIEPSSQRTGMSVFLEDAEVRRSSERGLGEAEFYGGAGEGAGGLGAEVCGQLADVAAAHG